MSPTILPPSRAVARLDGLTGLRFFAAIYVVAFHYATPALVGAPRAVLNIALSGYVAVDFFFILSGFILAYNYLKPDGALKGTKRQFWLARFARIYPAYALSFLICMPFALRELLRAEPVGTALYHFCRSLGVAGVMQQSWLPWMAMWGNAPAWSLSVEAFFYLVFPLLAPLVGRLSVRACIPALLAMWLVGLAVPTAYVVKDHVSPAHATAPGEPSWAPGTPVERPWLATSARSHDLVMNDFRSMTTPLARLPEFLVGVLLGRLLLGASALQRRRAGRCVVPALLLIVGLLAMSDHIPKPILRNGLLAPLFCVVIFGMSGGGSWLERVLSKKAFVPLGEASYGAYILQTPLANLLAFEGGSLLGFFGYAALLVGVSLLSFFKIETPARKFLMARLGAPRDLAPAGFAPSRAA
jgi:peptidoglycan/LPS O-acetylase OafA/YrhL